MFQDVCGCSYYYPSERCDMPLSLCKLHIDKQWYALGRFLSLQGLITISISNYC